MVPGPGSAMCVSCTSTNMNSRKYRVAGTGKPAQPTVIIVWRHGITLSLAAPPIWSSRSCSHAVVGRVWLAENAAGPTARRAAAPQHARRRRVAQRFETRVALAASRRAHADRPFRALSRLPAARSIHARASSPTRVPRRQRASAAPLARPDAFARRIHAAGPRPPRADNIAAPRRPPLALARLERPLRPRRPRWRPRRAARHDDTRTVRRRAADAAVQRAVPARAQQPQARRAPQDQRGTAIVPSPHQEVDDLPGT